MLPAHCRHAESLQTIIVRCAAQRFIAGQEKMARGSGMLNNKHQVFFDAINSEATEDCLDGIQAARVRRLLSDI